MTITAPAGRTPPPIHTQTSYPVNVGEHELRLVATGVYRVTGPDTGIPDAILDLLPDDASVMDWQFVGDILYTYFQ